MSDGSSEDLIESEGDLLALLEFRDLSEVALWLEDQLYDPVAAFHLEDSEGMFYAAGLNASLMDLESYAIQLEYPFAAEHFYDEVDAAVEHFYRHSAAAIVAGRPIGDPDDEDDGTADLADWAGVPTDDLALALAGRWDPYDGLAPMSPSGHAVYGWWVRSVPPIVALGVGGEAVYVEPLRLDGGAFLIEAEFPDEKVYVHRDAAEATPGWLTELRTAISTAEQGVDTP